MSAKKEVQSTLESFITIEELSGWLKVQPNTIRQWIGSDKIPSFKIAGKRLFDPNEIRKWIKRKSA